MVTPRSRIPSIAWVMGIMMCRKLFRPVKIFGDTSRFCGPHRERELYIMHKHLMKRKIKTDPLISLFGKKERKK